MSLDIRLSTGSHAAFCLDDDGYYWFLHPLFEDLKERTGQYIDLYGGATFSDESLGALQKSLSEATKMVQVMPDCWEVQVGVSIGSYLEPTSPTPIFRSVEKIVFLRLLNSFNDLVEAAIENQSAIVCMGD